MFSQFKITCDDLNDKSIFINWSNEEREKLFTLLLKRMSLTYFAKLINHDLPTLSEIKNGTVKPSGYVYFSILKILGLNVNLRSLSISSRNGKSARIINDYISPELLGLIHSDGFLVKNKKKVVLCGFDNKNKAMIERFFLLLGNTFECNLYVKKDKRDGTFSVRLPSVIGRILIKKFGEKSSKKIITPNLFDSEIPEYIRGVFDGDGSIYCYKNSKTSIPTIKISSGDKSHVKNLKHALKRIGINSRICFDSRKNSTLWNLIITKQKDVLKFIENIGSNHPKKKKRMKNMKQFFTSTNLSRALFPSS